MKFEGEDKREMLGFEDLTLAPYDKGLIVKDLLTSDEIVWINTYHSRVFEILSPELETDIKMWLEEACMPI